MATFLVDRVQETTAVTGTGAATLLGAVVGFKDFSAVGNGNATYYCIAAQAGAQWEVGLGTYTASGTTLSRDTVYSNYLGTTALINFSAGTKNIFITSPTALLSKLLVPQALNISNGSGIVVKQNNINGTLGVSNSGGWFFPQAITITTIVARVLISPKGTGSGITVPVKYGTAYIGSTLATTLVILPNQLSYTATLNRSIPANSYIYLDITNVGTTYAGAGLSIQISYTYTPI